jgi:hypothetical protein
MEKEISENIHILVNKTDNSSTFFFQERRKDILHIMMVVRYKTFTSKDIKKTS